MIFISRILLILLLVFLQGCAMHQPKEDKMDRYLGLNYHDYDEIITNNKAKQQDPRKARTSHEPSIPRLNNIAKKKPQVIAGDKIVTISVTEEVPIKDVLIELSRLTDIDVEIDPQIDVGIILKAKERPFSEVIERIAELAKLRYSNNNGILKIERDTPYIVNYPVDFLNISRSSTGAVTVNTALTSGSSGSSGSDSSSSSSSDSGSSSDVGSAASLTSGSSSAISTTYTGDLWTTIERDIARLINTGTQQGTAQTGTQATASNAEQNYGNFNRQAGMITVYAGSREHARVKNYLNKVRMLASSQVLIEAKFIEVTLTDQYRTGINWNKIDPRKYGITGVFTSASGTAASAGLTDAIRIGRFTKDGTDFNDSDDLEALVTLIQAFGTSRTLSSPRLHAMNNQQAVLSFVRNEVYFSLDISSSTPSTTGGTAATTTTVNSTLNTVPIGVILTLQPSINLDTQDITMNIRPTISRIVSRVTDPAVSFAVAQTAGTSAPVSLTDVQSQVPVVEIKELDSIMKIRSGDVMIIGGLMEERNSNRDSGAPYLMSIPLVGNMFKSVSKATDLIQTVIFIRATIVGNDYVTEEDKALYNDLFFKRDSYPLRLIKE